MGIGGGGVGGGWIVMQWSWRARRDEKKIFGLDGQLHPPYISQPPPPPLPPSSAAPRLPMSLTQAPCARPGSRALLRISLFGAPKWRPSKNERWAEHRSWIADARWVYTTMNRTMVSSAGGEFDRRRGRGGTCGENVYASFWAAI